jgi:hypothetical protein
MKELNPQNLDPNYPRNVGTNHKTLPLVKIPEGLRLLDIGEITKWGDYTLGKGCKLWWESHISGEGHMIEEKDSMFYFRGVIIRDT